MRRCGVVSPAVNVPFPADNPYSDKKRALGEALFHDKRLSVDFEPVVRHLPRPRPGLRRRQGHQPWRAGARSQASHADRVESRLVVAGVLGRAGAQPRGAGRGSDRIAGRDGAAGGRGGRAACGRSRHGARVCRGVSRRAAGRRRQSRQGDRHLRTDAGVADDPLRPVRRRRRAGAERQRDRRVSAVHRQGRLRALPQRICLYGLCLPRHRLARRRSRPRRGAAP